MRDKLLQEYQENKVNFENVEYEVRDIIFEIAGRVDDCRDQSGPRPIKHSYDKFEIDGENIKCYWHDYWSYGGEDQGLTIFPLSLFLNPETIDDYVKKLDDEDAKKNLASWVEKIKLFAIPG